MYRSLICMLSLMVAMLQLAPALHAQATTSGQTTASATKNPQASLDQDVSLLRQDVRSQKKQIIASNLQLTEAEAAKFWPVYDQYTAEVSKLGDQKYALIKEYAQGYGTLTNDEALRLIKRSLAMDEEAAQLRSKYVPIFNNVLPGTKTATFFQMDRRLNELIDLQLASEIPFVQEQTH